MTALEEALLAAAGPSAVEEARHIAEDRLADMFPVEEGEEVEEADPHRAYDGALSTVSSASAASRQ